MCTGGGVIGNTIGIACKNQFLQGGSILYDFPKLAWYIKNHQQEHEISCQTNSINCWLSRQPDTFALFIWLDINKIYFYQLYISGFCRFTLTLDFAICAYNLFLNTHASDSKMSPRSAKCEKTVLHKIQIIVNHNICHEQSLQDIK